MAIDDINVVDGLAVDPKQGILYLLLTDHLQWAEGEDTLSEREHLLLLQEKINAYVSFIEEGQYKNNYPNVKIKLAIIEIHFQYEITPNCQRFLQAVQGQIQLYGIEIQAHIG